MTTSLSLTFQIRKHNLAKLAGESPLKKGWLYCSLFVIQARFLPSAPVGRSCKPIKYTSTSICSLNLDAIRAEQCVSVRMVKGQC
jgi:hypothetical protein